MDRLAAQAKLMLTVLKATEKTKAKRVVRGRHVVMGKYLQHDVH